jgi:hypothetical protein
MAEKRTKADKEQRQADRVDDKAERRPGTGSRQEKSTQGLQPSRLVPARSPPEGLGRRIQ